MRPRGDARSRAAGGGVCPLCAQGPVQSVSRGQPALSPPCSPPVQGQQRQEVTKDTGLWLRLGLQCAVPKATSLCLLQPQSASCVAPRGRECMASTSLAILSPHTPSPRRPGTARHRWGDFCPNELSREGVRLPDQLAAPGQLQKVAGLLPRPVQVEEDPCTKGGHWESH